MVKITKSMKKQNNILINILKQKLINSNKNQLLMMNNLGVENIDLKKNINNYHKNIIF